MTGSDRRRRARHLRLLLRRSWLVALVALVAALVANTLASGSADSHRARQAMGLRNVIWNDVPVAHERNQGYVESLTAAELPVLSVAGTSVEVELPANPQYNNFNIIAKAPSAALASELATSAAAALVASQGGYQSATQPLRESLLAERVEVVADVDRLDVEVQAMLDEREARAEAGARSAELDRLRLDAQILDRERQIRSERLVSIDEQLRNLDNQDIALLDTIEVLRDPVVSSGDAARPLAVAGFVAFVAATVAALVMVWADRTVARLRHPGQLALGEGGPVTVVPSAGRKGDSAAAWSAGCQVLARCIDGAGHPGAVSLVGVAPRPLLQSLSRDVGERLGGGDAGPLVVPVSDPTSVLEAAASAREWILVLGRGRMRVGAANRLLGEVRELDLEPLAVVLVEGNGGDSPPDTPGSEAPDSASAGPPIPARGS
jgi:hypothetical protein